MRRRFFLIFNSRAGLSRRAAVEAVTQRLIASGADVMWSPATTAEAACAAAREAALSGAFDAVVAAGGDGTIRQAVIGLAGTDMPLGIIPLGTGNVLAHEIDVDRRPDALAAMLRSGPVAAARYGLANGVPFLLMVGAGFDGRVIADLNHAVKNRVAKLAYVGPTMAALRAPLDRIDVEIDGRRQEAAWAVIANARCYGGAFVMAPKTKIDAPGLQAILFQARSRAVLFAQLLALAAGRLERRKDVEMIACSAVRMTAAGAVPVQIDGDVAGALPVEVTADAGTVQLIRGRQ
jgi:diacylglycerol kinase (ATP)